MCVLLSWVTCNRDFDLFSHDKMLPEMWVVILRDPPMYKGSLAPFGWMGYCRSTGDALLWRHNGRDGVSNHQPHDSTVYSGADHRKHQSSASLVFVRGIHRWAVNSPHKWPVTRKMFPFDDVIMNIYFFGRKLECIARLIYVCISFGKLNTFLCL